VLTGSQIPGARIESDARRNFVNAVREIMHTDFCGEISVPGPSAA
jgi:L-asparaginase/Glu-tRNA(Gln) amidotransferase subunit D